MRHINNNKTVMHIKQVLRIRQSNYNYFTQDPQVTQYTFIISSHTPFNTHIIHTQFDTHHNTPTMWHTHTQCDTHHTHNVTHTHTHTHMIHTLYITHTDLQLLQRSTHKAKGDSQRQPPPLSSSSSSTWRPPLRPALSSSSSSTVYIFAQPSHSRHVRVAAASIKAQEVCFSHLPHTREFKMGSISLGQG